MLPQITANKLKFIKFKRNFQRLSNIYKSINKSTNESPQSDNADDMSLEVIDKQDLELKMALFSEHIKLGIEKTETLIGNWDPFENKPKLEAIVEIIKLADLAILKGIALTELELEVATNLCTILHSLIHVEFAPTATRPLKEHNGDLNDKNLNDKDSSDKVSSQTLDLMNSQGFHFIPDIAGHELVKTISASEINICEGMLDPEIAKKPFKVQGLIDDWPAMHQWSFENFLRKFWFRSTVIEIGRKYTDQNWKQEILTIHEYVLKLIAQSKHIERRQSNMQTKKSPEVSDIDNEDEREQQDTEGVVNGEIDRQSPPTVEMDIEKLEAGSINDSSSSQKFKLANIKNLSNELLASESKLMPTAPIVSSKTTSTLTRKLSKKNLYDEENLIIQNNSFSNFYLAQNALLTQIPELRDDIEVPEFILNVMSYTRIEPEICAWIGPAGTFSPLHTDPKDNLFCQVKGIKYFKFVGPDGYKSYCYVHPGECIYIPKHMGHQVLSKTTSFGINFWFC